MHRVEVEIRTVATEDAASLAQPLLGLLAELSPGNAPLEVETVAERLRDARVRVLVALSEERLIGAATLTLLVTLADGLVGRVEDVIVSPSARGLGVGRSLMDALHAEARELGLAHVDLTSRPSREAANAMYLALGYERRDTNVYRWHPHPRRST